MRRPLLLVIALVAAGLALPASTAQAAVPSTTRLFYVADGPSHPGVYGVYSSDPDGTHVKNVVPARNGVLISSAAVSPDGSQVAYLRTDQVATQLWMVDSGGGNAHSVYPWTHRHTFGIRWSSDGIYYSDPLGTDHLVHRIIRAYHDHLPMENDQVAGTEEVRDPIGTVGSYAGGPVVTFDGQHAPSALPGSPQGTSTPSTSADGSTVAFSRAVVHGADLQALNAGTVTVLDAGSYAGYSYRPFVFGSTVYYDRERYLGVRGELYSVPLNGSAAPTRITTTPSTDERSVSVADVPTTYTQSAVAEAPGVTLAGAHPQISLPGYPRSGPYAMGSDIDVWLCRTAGTVAPTSPCATPVYYQNGAPFIDSVTFGQTYTYTVFLTDQYGNFAPSSASTTMQAVGAPAITLASPTSTTSATVPFPVSWATATASGATYDVSFASRTAPSSALSAFQPWLTATAEPSAVFGAGGTPVVPVQGATYYFRVTGHDAYGNTTALADSKALLPVDQAAASFSKGWAAEGRTGRFLNTITGTVTPGASASISLTGTAYYVIGERCQTCGQFRVYVDGKLWGTIDTHSTTYQQRVVLFARGIGAYGPRTLKVVAVGTKGHPRVNLDAFGAS